jgi:hypothetical protein
MRPTAKTWKMPDSEPSQLIDWRNLVHGISRENREGRSPKESAVLKGVEPLL